MHTAIVLLQSMSLSRLQLPEKMPLAIATFSSLVYMPIPESTPNGRSSRSPNKSEHHKLLLFPWSQRLLPMYATRLNKLFQRIQCSKCPHDRPGCRLGQFPIPALRRGHIRTILQDLDRNLRFSSTSSSFRKVVTFIIAGRCGGNATRSETAFSSCSTFCHQPR